MWLLTVIVHSAYKTHGSTGFSMATLEYRCIKYSEELVRGRYGVRVVKRSADTRINKNNSVYDIISMEVSGARPINTRMSSSGILYYHSVSCGEY